MATRAAKLALRGKALSDTGTEIGIVNNADATAITVDSNENVGIGTSSPTGKLSISGTGTQRIDIANTSLTDAGEMVSLQWDANADFTIQGRGSDASFKSNWYRIEASSADGLADNHIWYTGASTERMRLDSSGNVGIGTNSPSVPLHVKKTGSTSAVQEFIRSENHALGGTGAGSSMNFHHYHGGGGPAGGAKAASITAVNSGSWAGGTPSSYSTALTFGTIHENTFDERLRIDSSGNVGIGTTTPNTKLKIENNTDTDYSISSGATNYGLSIVNTTSGANNSAGILLGTESNGEIYLSAVQNSGNSASDFRIATRHSGSRSDKFIVSSAGHVTAPYQPAFKQGWDSMNAGSSRTLATNSSGISALTDRDVFNIGSHFNVANGRFTAPVAGTYVLGFSFMRNGTNGSNIDARIKKNGSLMYARYYVSTYTSTYEVSTLTTISNCSAGDYFTVELATNMSLYSDDSYSFGYLVG